MSVNPDIIVLECNTGKLKPELVLHRQVTLKCEIRLTGSDGAMIHVQLQSVAVRIARIIAASNRNLEEEIKNGWFPEDPFYRLNVFPITVPPLRQRQEDIPLLVNHYSTAIKNVTLFTSVIYGSYVNSGHIRTKTRKTFFKTQSFDSL